MSLVGPDGHPHSDGDNRDISPGPGLHAQIPRSPSGRVGHSTSFSCSSCALELYPVGLISPARVPTLFALYADLLPTYTPVLKKGNFQ